MPVNRESLKSHSDVNDNLLLFNFYKYIDVFGEKIAKLQIHSSHEQGNFSGLPKISTKLSSILELS